MNWLDGSLAEGLRCYRAEQFFEAHEYWESVWLTLAEPPKSFLQSLIQISAAFHHLRRGNRIGAVSLLSRSVRRLDQCPPTFCRINIQRLRNGVRTWLDALANGRAQLPETFPEIEIVDSHSNGTARPTES